MKQDKSIYYPLFASRRLNGGLQDDQEFDEVQQSVEVMPPQQRRVLLSANFAEAIAVLDEQYHLPEQYVEYITVLIREMFFGHSSEFEVLRVLRTELAKIPGISLDAVIQHIQLNVFRAQPDPEEPDEEEVVTDTPVAAFDGETKEVLLLDALAKYPRLGDQVLTSEKIKLRQSVEPARPTLTNWLKVYRDDLGIGKHDAASRAQFLFEGVNTKTLSSAERDHIHTLIRSLEDDEALLLDVRQQTIIFPATAEPKQQSAPRQGMQQQRNALAAAASNTAPVTPVSTPEPAAKDLFERFSESRRSPEEPALRNVGTASFGSVRTPVNRTLAQEKAILEKIKTPPVTPATVPAAPSPFARTESSVPAGGTLRFSAKQVLPSERYEAPAATSAPQNITPTPAAPTPVPQPAPQATLQQSAQSMVNIQRPPVAAAPVAQPLPVTPSVQPAPVKRPAASPQQNMFRIKPSQE
jgi:hypothetical protein